MRSPSQPPHCLSWWILSRRFTVINRQRSGFSQPERRLLTSSAVQGLERPCRIPRAKQQLKYCGCGEHSVAERTLRKTEIRGIAPGFRRFETRRAEFRGGNRYGRVAIQDQGSYQRKRSCCAG